MLNTNSDIYKHEVYASGKPLGIEESEPVKVLEGATNKVCKSNFIICLLL